MTMKSERMNNVILFVSAMVFILQSVGYFAPAWFIKEIVVNSSKGGTIADGRTFKLPYWDELAEADMQPNNDNRMFQETNDAFQKADMISPEDSEQTVNRIPLHAVIVSNSSKETWTSATESTTYSTKKMIQDGAETNEVNSKTRVTDKKKTKAYALYLSAGLWYSTACIYLAENGYEDRMKWCSLYVRTDDNTLERKKNMFEFRIEATAALALSALSLILASTGCCSHRRHGTRVIASLSTMFLSGSAMAIPVVHMIIEHIGLHGNIVSRRRMKHHLFDHYSVMICAVASIFSIVSTVIITIIKCRNNLDPTDWYDVTRDDKKKKEHIRELPDIWVHNPKIALPVVTKIKDDVRDETESGYCEMKEEEPAGSSIETVSVVCEKDTNDFGQLELVDSELETFEM